MPLLTPPLFPLSLLSQLTQSIPSAFCYNNITCHPLQSYDTQPTLSTSDLPSSSFTSISIIPEIMIANTPSQRAPLLVPHSKPFMLHLCLIRVHQVARSLREPMSANFWKGLRICVMTTKWQLLRKSAAYLDIVRCLPLAMLDL